MQMPDKRDQYLPEARITGARHRLDHCRRDVLFAFEYHSVVSWDALR